MNRKQRRSKRFKAHVRVPIPQPIDPAQIFGCSLGEILAERSAFLEDVLHQTPTSEHEKLKFIWARGDEKIRRIFRGDIRQDELRDLMHVTLRPPS